MNIISLLRQYRIGPFPIFDLALAYVGIYLLAPRLTKLARFAGLYITRTQWLWLTLPIGVIFHLILAQSTPFTTMIIDPHGGYLAKAILVAMLYLGLKGSRHPREL